MSTQTYTIEIKDKISPSIDKKLASIGNLAEKAQQELTSLQQVINEMAKSPSIDVLKFTSGKVRSDINDMHKLALQSEKVALASAKCETELKKQALASAKLEIEHKKLASADTKLAIEQDKLSQSQARTSILQSQSAISANRAAASESMLVIAKNKGQISTIKLNDAEWNHVKVLNQVKTAQNQTQSSLYNLSSAQNRAAMSALALARAQAASRAGAGGAGGAGLSLGGPHALSSLKGAVAPIAGAYLGYQGLKQVSEFANDYTSLQNKLRNVVETEGQLVKVTSDIMDIANRTRQPVLETAQAFQRFDLALKQNNVSQAESLRMTETVNKMLVISGANTGESASALLQLSQAFNKGKLDGDEFRTVMETMPPVADAIAKNLKVTRGELLELAPKGVITAEVMRKAFASVSDEIDNRFSKTIPTASQKIVVFKNTLTQVFGEIEKEQAILSDLTSVFEGIGKFVKENKQEIGDIAKALYSTSKAIFEVTTSFTMLIDKKDGLKIIADLLGMIADGWELIAAVGKDAMSVKDPMTFMKAWITGQGTPHLNAFADKKEQDLKEKTRREFYAMGGGDLVQQLNEMAAPHLGTIKINVADLNKPIKDTVKTIKEAKPHYESFVKMNKMIADQFSANQMLYTTFREFKTIGDILPKGTDYEKQLEIMRESRLKTVEERKGSFAQTALGLKLAGGKAKPSELIGLGEGLFEGTSVEIDAAKEKWQEYYDRIKLLRDLNLISAKQATEAEFKLKANKYNEELSQAQMFFNNMSSLMNTNSERSFKIGKAAAIASATIDAHRAISGAYASGAALGGPWVGALQAAAASVFAYAQISKIASTKYGGAYETGGIVTGGQQMITINEKGEEFVMNARATAKNRPVLEAMNSGKSVGMGINVVIENYGSNKEFEVQQLTPNDVRIIATDEIKKQVPNLVSSDIANPNSRISKSLNSNINAQRRN